MSVARRVSAEAQRRRRARQVRRAASLRAEPDKRRRARRLPLTASGWTLLVLGVVAYVGGWLLGWVELMVVAAGCLIALLVAVPFVIGRLALDVERTLQPDRVTVGDRAIAVVKVTNPRRAPISSRTIEEHVGGRPLRLDIPPLGPGRSTEAVYPLPTARRGVVEVGPAIIVKADLLGLMRREIVQTGTQTLWVHPRVTALAPLPVGFAKDLEGPTSDASPAGDVAFHALREYEIGDDHRHIHWMSSARTGTLMVRHHVDNRRPNLTVVVDTGASAYSSAREFDTAIEIAASLAVSSMVSGQPVSVYLDREVVMGHLRPASRTSVLDRLTLADGSEDTDVGASALQALRAETGTSALVVVTGNVPPERFLAMASVARRSARVILVRVWPPGDRLPGSLPGAKVVDVDDLDHFRAAWERVS